MKCTVSSLQRAAKTPVQFVNLFQSALLADSFGVQARSITLLWHNRVKDPERINLLHNFSRLHSCLAQGRLAEERLVPRLECSGGDEQRSCAPPNSSWCTLSPLCARSEFQYQFDRQQWVRCEGRCVVRSEGLEGLCLCGALCAGLCDVLCVRRSNW